MNKINKTNKKRKTLILFFMIVIVLLGTYLIRNSEEKKISSANLDIEEKNAMFFIGKDFKKYNGKSFYVKKDNLYMSIDEISKLLDLEYEENFSKDEVIIKKGKKRFTIDYDKKVIIESNRKTSIIQKNNIKLIKVSDILKEFNERIDYLRAEKIYRIKKKNSTILDIELLKKHEEKTGLTVGNYKQKYEREKHLFEKNNPDLKIKTKMVEIPNKKIAYLTFDDGPKECTEAIIDTLNEYGIKATFFTLGYNVVGRENIVKKAYDTGHSIGLHGVTHNIKNVYASPENFLREMEENNDIIEKAIGIRTKLIRPPYGSKPWLTQNFRDLLYENDYRVWDWNIDSKDYPSSRTADSIVNSVKSQVEYLYGEPVIILFHDKEQTLNALRQIIEYMKYNGYEFGEITENIYPMNFWKDKRVKE